ncbi:hypothetical protein TrLO_g12922 [Triparma laevis f. longispina]|uniref:Leucine-rich repeat domain-containing protein n=1 Tax=Triparma laevis f. longispina TaxID=1714387 RepID=A0A9W7FQB3_9STRA|nr:hypothetical protein TrLO_g12922 [Triparma laevis f. longispina]
MAFHQCLELKSITIPDSLQTLGIRVFDGCYKLVPSNIDVSDWHNDTTSEVVAHLRSEMSLNALLSGNNFLNTDDFRRLIVPFLPNDALTTIRLASKPWSRVAEEFIGDGVESRTMIVRGEEDIPFSLDLKERHEKVTRVIFLLNIMKIGEYSCAEAVNLVVIDIPEGVESIGQAAFGSCRSLTTISFPTTLTSIGRTTFAGCSSLDNVDLLLTNLQGLGNVAFTDCSELKSVTIPDSLQTLGGSVFWGCSKLVPSNIIANESEYDVTSEVVAYLRSQQSPTT